MYLPRLESEREREDKSREGGSSILPILLILLSKLYEALPFCPSPKGRRGKMAKLCWPDRGERLVRLPRCSCHGAGCPGGA